MLDGMKGSLVLSLVPIPKFFMTHRETTKRWKHGTIQMKGWCQNIVGEISQRLDIWCNNINLIPITTIVPISCYLFIFQLLLTGIQFQLFFRNCCNCYLEWVNIRGIPLNWLMLTQEELLKEANRIIKEFGKYTKQFEIVDSFYHGTYGRW